MHILRKWLAGAAKAAPAAAATAPARVAAATDPAGSTASTDPLSQVDLALERAPDDAELHFARASILVDQGRIREAVPRFARAESCGMRGPRLDFAFGWALLQDGQPRLAEARLRGALAQDPESARTAFALGMALRAQGRSEDAATVFRDVVRLDPRDVHCLRALAACAFERGDFAAADAHLRDALALDAQSPDTWNDLCAVESRMGRLDEALAAAEEADRCDRARGAHGDAFVNLATCHFERGRLAAGMRVLEDALAQRPHAGAHHAYALAQMAAGRLREGQTHYEFRWLREPLVSRRHVGGQPAWNGQDLRGRTILLRAEQGMGDAIQFARYAPLVKALGARVLLTQFGGLAGMFAGVDRVVEEGDAIEYDYYVHLLSLPRIFGTEVATIPAALPYLRVDDARARHWRARLGADARMRVGLAWAGSPAHVRDRHRSLSLEQLAPLRDVEGVRWISLQKGPREDEGRAPPAGWTMENLAPDLRDFGDTAALVDALDLVICVDTSVAHLAGALGKPTWLMLPTPADFRWLETREDSPWYPGMRLFRQRERGNWADVIARVRAALTGLAAHGPTSAGTASVAPRDAPPEPVRPRVGLAREAPGHRPGWSAVAETRHGIVQYLPDAPGIGDALDWYGEWLQPQLDVLGRMLRPGMTVLEACAGIGAHTLWLARRLGPDGHLLVSEAQPLAQRILRQNLVANRIANVTVLRSAVDAAAGTVDGLRLERLDWLKVSAGERVSAILAGADETMWRLRPRLWLAVVDPEGVTRLAEVARMHGYRCWRHETALYAEGNFNRRCEDIHAGRTALALLAIPEEVDVDGIPAGCIELP